MRMSQETLDSVAQDACDFHNKLALILTEENGTEKVKAMALMRIAADLSIARVLMEQQCNLMAEIADRVGGMS